MKPKLRIDIDPSLADLIEGFGQLERIGDIVPYAFFEELKMPGGRRPAFRVLAKALVLSYIVSWHMPKILPIEGVEVHRKRFQGDSLKLVYSQLADIFKFSADTACLAVKDLADNDKVIIKGRDEEGYVHVVPKLKEITALLAKWKAKQDARMAKAKGTAIPRSETPVTDPLQSANPAATATGLHAATSATTPIPLAAVGIPVAAAPLPLAEAPSPLGAVTPTARSGIPLPVAAAPHTAQSGTSQFRSQFPSQNRNPLPPSPGQSPSEAGSGSCPPLEVSPTATGGKPPGPPRTPNDGSEVQEDADEGQLQSDQEQKQDQDQEAGDPHDAHELASMWLNLMCIVIGKSVVFPAAAIEAASEFFRDNPDWNILDVLWVCFQGYLVAKDNPNEDQKFFNCRRFATNPQKMFALNSDNRVRLIRMSEELGYDLDITEDYAGAVNKELVRIGKKPLYKEEQVGEAQPEVPAQQCIPVSDDDDNDDEREHIGTAYRKVMARLGLDLSLDRDAIRSAAEFLANDDNYSSGDIVAICVLGALAALQNPPPPDGKPDPFPYCGNFALSPKEIFGRNGAGDLRLLKMACELNYEPLPPTDIIEAIDGAIVTVEKNDWFGHLKELAEWQEKQAEERRNDPRQYDLVDHFNCL